jgi:heptosyltransferase III
VPLEKLLLLQPRWMGDVLLCTPAIRAARRAFPQARIDFVTEAAGAAVLSGNPDLSSVIGMPAAGGRRLSLLRTLNRARYDAVVDFRSTGSTAVLTGATRAPVRIGLRGRGLRNLAYSQLLPKEKGSLYMARQKLAMLQPLGVDVDGADIGLHITIDDEQRERARRVWQECGFADPVPVVAISSVSRVAGKQWGTGRWAAVADAVTALGARVLLTSGPGEREAAAATAALMRTPAVWDYGHTSLRGLAALYQRCALWIGNDGGPKHIAAAAGVPTLTVFRYPIGPVWTDTADPRHAYLQPVDAGEDGADVPVASVIRLAEELLARPSRT